MCVVSYISDWGKGVTYPQPIGYPPYAKPGIVWTHDSWAEYQQLLKRAAGVDAILDQPDCEDPVKQAWMADVEATLAKQDAADTPQDACTERSSPSGTTQADNYLDDNGKPAGGWVDGVGFTIDWQNGPLGRDEDRLTPNGAFVEEVLWAALQRIQHYNDTEFRCRENSLAITKIEEALHWLNARTADREARKVEGTHAV